MVAITAGRLRSPAGVRAALVLLGAGAPRMGERDPHGVFVSNLPVACEEADLRSAMSAQFGAVRRVKLAPARGDGTSSRFGSVAFEETASASRALEAGSLALGLRAVKLQPLFLKAAAPAGGRAAPLGGAGPRQPPRPGGPPLRPTRGALLHRLMRCADDAAALRSVLASLGPLQSCREYSMAASAWGRAGDGGRVLALLGEMEAAGVAKDGWLYAAAITALTHAGEPEEALRLFDGMGGVGRSVFAYAAAIRACAALGQSARSAERALAILGAMRADGVPPNVVAYNALITALGSAGLADAALAQLGAMEADGVRPDLVTLHAAMGACATSVPPRSEAAVALLRGMRARGLAPVTRSFNAALHACAASGDWAEAEALLAAMGAAGLQPDAISANCALFAAAKGGNWRLCLALLAELEQAPPAPFGCSARASLLCGVSADVASYGSAMQALAAAGELERGFELLERATAALGDAQLPATYVLHAALLAACQDAGDEARAASLRETMRARGLANALQPLAAVTLSAAGGGGARLEFANGREPAELAAATVALCEAVAAASHYRTAANARALPSDFVQRASGAALASSLRHHAEKKALASLLQRAEPELAVRINLKACADCHEFFKGASLLLRRPIRLHEPKLLHTFEGGACSCADSWRWEERARLDLAVLGAGFGGEDEAPGAGRAGGAGGGQAPRRRAGEGGGRGEGGGDGSARPRAAAPPPQPRTPRTWGS